MDPPFTPEWFSDCWHAVCALIDRAQLLANVEVLESRAEEKQDAESRGQFSLLDMLGERDPLVLREIDVSREDLFLLLKMEKETMGMYLTIHPLDLRLFLGVIDAAYGELK